MPNQRVPAYLALILAEIIWGALLVITKPALEYVSATQFLFLRYLIALPFILPVVVITWRKHNFPFKSLSLMSVHELLACLNLLLLYVALESVSALQASLLITIRPVFITIAGIFLLKEHEENHELVGLLCATIGATLIASGQFADNVPFKANLMTGLILLTNFLDALLTVNFKKRMSFLPKPSLNAFHILFAGTFYTLLNVSKIPETLSLAIHTPPVLYAAIFAGFLGTNIAALISIYGVSKIEISEATLFSYIKPLVYIPLSLLWLSEQINLLQLGGLCLIFIGVSLAESREPTHWFIRLFKLSNHHHANSYYLRH